MQLHAGRDAQPPIAYSLFANDHQLSDLRLFSMSTLPFSNASHWFTRATWRTGHDLPNGRGVISLIAWHHVSFDAHAPASHKLLRSYLRRILEAVFALQPLPRVV
jgi:hypothetical protein